jgi:hypothetical protein
MTSDKSVFEWPLSISCDAAGRQNAELTLHLSQMSGPSGAGFVPPLWLGDKELPGPMSVATLGGQPLTLKTISFGNCSKIVA